MKRIISVLLAALCIIGCTAATAEGLDFASMSDEELLSIIDAANAELAKRGVVGAEPEEPTEAAEAAVPDGALIAEEGAVLIDQDGVTVTLSGDNDLTFGMLDLGVIVTNDNDQSVGITLDTASVNGWDVSGFGVSDTSAGGKQKDSFTLFVDDADISSIDDIEELKLEVYLYDSDEWERLSDNITITLTFPG